MKNKLESRSVTLEIKSTDQDKIVNGVPVVEIVAYGSIFNNIDSYNDIVQKGAFSDVKLPLPLKYEHSEGIGTITDVKEDIKGMLFTAYIPKSEATLIDKIKINTFRTSIGFVTKSYRYDDDKNRILEKVDLKEISLVSNPANESTEILSVKNSDPDDPKESEEVKEDQNSNNNKFMNEEKMIALEEKASNLENELKSLKEDKSNSVEEVKSIQEELRETQKSLLEVKQSLVDNTPEEKKSFSTEFKSGISKIQNKEVSEIEVKADLFNENVTNGVASIGQITGQFFDNSKELDVLSSFTTIPVSEGTKKAVWIESSLGSASVFGEGSATIDSSATEEEFDRYMVRAGLAHKFSEEHLANPNFMLSTYATKMNQVVRLFANKEVFQGGGADTSGNTKKIYGILGHGWNTASQIKTALTSYKTAAPTKVDLIRALMGVIRDEGFIPTAVYINHADYIQIRSEKTTSGAYVVPMLEEELGLKIYQTSGVPAGKVVVADGSLIQLHIKGGQSTRVERINSDALDRTVHVMNDLYLQVVIPSNCKKGVIIGDFTKVDDWLKV